MEESSYIASKAKPLDLVVHPTVLLSIVDHYNRLALGTKKRVVGTLLGEEKDGKLHVTSSFGVPFEEDTKDPKVWFLDHNYHEELSAMYKKVNAKETVIGWYSSGPKIKPADIQIHEVFRKYLPEPVFLIMEVEPKGDEVPMEAYYSVREKTHDSTFTRTFKTIGATFGAEEAEEVGVEHLLRDLKNKETSTLSTRIEEKSASLKTLVTKLQEIKAYVEDVLAGKFEANAAILGNLQNIFNEMPELGMDTAAVKAAATETNDFYLNIYVGSIIRSLLAMHNLIKNKISNKERVEKAAEEKKKKEEKEKEEGEAKKKKEEEKKKGGS